MRLYKYNLTIYLFCSVLLIYDTRLKINNMYILCVFIDVPWVRGTDSIY